MQKSRFRADRLLKLAAHLEAGRPGGHKKFDFATWSENHATEKHCGTAGCAVGELPVIFPRLAYFEPSYFGDSERNVCGRIADRKYYNVGLASVLFGIPTLDAENLFTWDKPRWWAPSLPYLASRATAKQVARSIRLYVKARKELKSSERA